ncbi:MAG: hypothetical protein KKH94_06445 [Candidatus Omnitrophica bacterium]|nr:hypothetical protein [Candidatus Omnitrophota bacterium]
MSTVTHEETRFIKRIILLVIIPLIIGGLIKVKLSSTSETLQGRIKEEEQKIAGYFLKNNTMPTTRRVSEAREKLGSFDEAFQTIASFSTVPPILPPEDVIEKGVYFKKQLYVAKKGLNALAAKNEIDIPDTLGFGEVLPTEREVPLLLRKLETINKVMTIILENNVKLITVVKLLDDQHFTDIQGNEIPFMEIGGRIDVNCTHEDLTRILHAIGALKPFIVIKSLGTKKIKDDILETSFIFSRFIMIEK